MLLLITPSIGENVGIINCPTFIVSQGTVVFDDPGGIVVDSATSVIGNGTTGVIVDSVGGGGIVDGEIVVD